MDVKQIEHACLTLWSKEMLVDQKSYLTDILTRRTRPAYAMLASSSCRTSFFLETYRDNLLARALRSYVQPFSLSLFGWHSSRSWLHPYTYELCKRETKRCDALMDETAVEERRKKETRVRLLQLGTSCFSLSNWNLMLYVWSHARFLSSFLHLVKKGSIQKSHTCLFWWKRFS